MFEEKLRTIIAHSEQTKQEATELLNSICTDRVSTRTSLKKQAQDNEAVKLIAKRNKTAFRKPKQ